VSPVRVTKRVAASKVCDACEQTIAADRVHGCESGAYAAVQARKVRERAEFWKMIDARFFGAVAS
jgi:hypothetical protein